MLVSASTTSPSSRPLADTVAAVASAPTSSTGIIDAKLSALVAVSWALMRTAGGSGRLRRYGSHGFSRFSAIVSPRLNKALTMTANTDREMTACVASTGSSATARFGTTKNSSDIAGKTIEPMIAMGTRSVSSRSARTCTP